VTNPLGNGQVDGRVSLADKAEFKKKEHEMPDNESENEKSLIN